ncbi:MAG: hypothetical protein IJH96_04925 [Ruminococcus sp.]|nr:hypothetical protein [Ruminococcus sp.]
MPFLSSLYVFLWVALAILCCFTVKKLGVVSYLLTVFFIFMALWYGLNTFGNLPVFEGVWGNVFRGVLIVFFVVIVFIWYRGRKMQRNAQNKVLPHAEDCHCEHCEDKHEEP